MENENKVEFVEITDDNEEFSSLSDLQQQFIKSPKVGENVELKVKGFKIVRGEELEFTYEKNGKQKTATNALSNVDYGIKIINYDDAVFWVNSWSVFGQLKAIAKKLGTMTLKDVEVQINHIANGMIEENKEKAWIVKTKINNEWKSLNRDTNNWE